MSMEKFPIYDILPEGQENAIPSEALMLLMDFGSVRELRAAVERERRLGAIILSNKSRGGYYRSNKPDDIKRYIQTMEASGYNTIRSLESARRRLKELEQAE